MSNLKLIETKIVDIENEITSTTSLIINGYYTKVNET